ncbi:MAG TPA: type II toxin-antitoxin system HicB family antitoxin [Burkholderiaceae bacterium]|nr:type II toxin-antitoxin system HicB family antitoxin [Burkholderiaceae bacterium]
MKYRVALRRVPEGFSAFAPALPGCWSQGRTQAEALENIGRAIRQYLVLAQAATADCDVHEIDIEP